MREQRPSSSITWFYYDDFVAAVAFYHRTLDLPRVLDQGWTQVFRVAERAFVGLVDATSGRGTFRSKRDNAVLLTLVVDDVETWLERLSAAGVSIDRGIEYVAEIEVRTLFATDPGGYRLEFQEFLNEETRSVFH